MLEQVLIQACLNKNGIEIGGPSFNTGPFIYAICKSLDNVVFSNTTVWHEHKETYDYFPGKTGKVIINDAVDLNKINNEQYEFCFASHVLEHIANPLKSIKEWLRVITPQSYLILILPEKTCCFDHKREISSFDTLLKQYENNVGEDDLSTLPEILEKHDLSLDPGAKDFEYFKQRSYDNYNNRCLHHYVYSQELLLKICNYFNCEFVHTITYGLDIWFIMKKI